MVSNNESMTSKTEFTIPSLDGHSLGATFYQRQVDTATPKKKPNAKAIMVIAGATGVPQGFYRRFAEATVKQGFCALTFDYRGIGKSKNAPLKGFDMDYLDWAQKDLAAVLQHANSFGLPVFIIGHSYGGHAIGLLPELSNIKGAWTFGTGAGWHGWMPKSEQWRVKFMWNFLGPVFTRIFGYLAWSRLGMGEDLPLGVYKQWKRWCAFPNYFFDDPKMKGISDKFDRVEFPVVAVNSVDDDWATPASRDAFMNNYRNAQLKLKTIEPDVKKQRAIGHMGYFKSHSEELWQSVFDWVEQFNLAAE